MHFLPKLRFSVVRSSGQIFVVYSEFSSSDMSALKKELLQHHSKSARFLHSLLHRSTSRMLMVPAPSPSPARILAPILSALPQTRTAGETFLTSGEAAVFVSEPMLHILPVSMEGDL